MKRTRPVILFLLAMVFARGLAAQYSLDYFKQTNFGLSDCTVRAHGVVETENSGYFLSCFKYCNGAPNGSRYTFIVSVDSMGDTLSSLHDVLGYGPLHRATSGDYLNFSYELVSPTSFGSTELRLTRFDLTWQTEWSTVFDFPLCGNYVGGITTTSDGGYALCGFNSYVSCSFPAYESYLIKFDENGVEEWRKAYQHHPDNTEMKSVVEMNDGGFTLFGWAGGSASSARNFHLMRTDTAGDTLWTKEYGQGLANYGYNHVMTNDGGLVFCGFGGDFGDFNVYLTKVDQNGDELWTQQCYGAGNNPGYKVIELHNGNLALVGAKQDTAYPANTAGNLLITDASGNELWNDSKDYTPTDIIEMADGDLLVTGYVYSPTSDKFEAVYIRYDFQDTVGGEDSLNHVHTLPAVWNIGMFPNPVRDLLNIKSDAEITECSIYNMNGQMILRERVSGKAVSINTGQLKEGIYYVTVIAADGRYKTQRIARAR